MPVEYGLDAQQRRAERAVTAAAEDLASIKKGSAGELDFAARARFSLLGAELFYLCSSFKSIEWESEQEWRLIYARSGDDGPDALRIEARPDGVPFVRLDLTRTIDKLARPIYAAIREGPLSARNGVDIVQRYLREQSLSIPWEKQMPFDD
jgi:hypothetical protein